MQPPLTIAPIRGMMLLIRRSLESIKPADASTRLSIAPVDAVGSTGGALGERLRLALFDHVEDYAVKIEPVIEESDCILRLVVRDPSGNIKLSWLAIRDIEDRRACTRAKEKGFKAADLRTQGQRSKATVNGWKAALGGFALAYSDRIESYLA